jgi:hypothetical protein
VLTAEKSATAQLPLQVGWIDNENVYLAPGQLVHEGDSMQTGDLSGFFL